MISTRPLGVAGACATCIRWNLATAGVLLLAMLTLTTRADTAVAQSAGVVASLTPADTSTSLDELIAEALSVHPSIRAARDRVDAAQAAVDPAGAPPDPMLMVGISNYPVTGEAGFRDDMTMKMIGVGQVFPFPGKLGIRRRIAELEVAAAEAEVEAATWSVRREVIGAYADLVFLERALEIVRRSESVLASFIGVTESRYGVGTGGQSDVLMARVEVARLAEEAVAIVERSRAALARLNAALNRPSETPVQEPVLPARISRAAVADDPEDIRFASSALGSRAADSPLPPLAQLQEMAVLRNPGIRAHEAMIQAQAARVELARREHLPDFDVSIQYGQRADHPDMLSATVSIPIPLRKGQRQDLLVRQAEAELSALQAEHHERANEIRATVAGAYADLERDRAQLALYVKAILPQGQAALESATASFQVGRVDFLRLLESQATLFDYETSYYDTLTRFADRLAALESTVGAEVLR